MSLGLPDEAIAAHRRMLEGAARIDIFGVREAGEIDGVLHAPLESRNRPCLQPGRRYLVEAVVRNLRVGHHLTQGTADSNELWVDVTAKRRRSGDRAQRRHRARRRSRPLVVLCQRLCADPRTASGSTGATVRTPSWPSTTTRSRRARRRSCTTCCGYRRMSRPDHHRGGTALPQVRYDLPEVRAGRRFRGNDLPVTPWRRIACSWRSAARGRRVRSLVAGTKPAPWERWNDYGIGLLLSGEAQQSTLRQAEHAFAAGRGAGPPGWPAQSGAGVSQGGAGGRRRGRTAARGRVAPRLSDPGRAPG